MSTLLTANFPAAFYQKLFDTCFPPLVQLCCNVAMWFQQTACQQVQKQKVLSAVLEVLYFAMISPLLPQSMRQAIAALVAASPFMHTALRFTRMAFVPGQHACTESDQLSALHFWASYAWLVTWLPAVERTSAVHSMPPASRFVTPEMCPLDTCMQFGTSQQSRNASCLSGRDVIFNRSMCPWVGIGDGTQQCDVSKDLTRAEALNVLQPLVDLPMGVIMQVVHSEHCFRAPVIMAALSILRNIFICRGCPFIQSDVMSAHYIQ